MANTITYLDVPFSKKTEAKLYGALWDVKNKRWYYIGENAGLNKFKMVYLDIPFKEKERAKSVGAKWDTEKSSGILIKKTSKKPISKNLLLPIKFIMISRLIKKTGLNW